MASAGADFVNASQSRDFVVNAGRIDPLAFSGPPSASSSLSAKLTGGPPPA